MMTGKSDEIPRTIWCLWFQGWDEAPPIVQACARTWHHHNPDWDIRYLTSDTVRDWIEAPSLVHENANKGMRAEALSNLVRTELLTRYGGVWVDATTYCLKPLDAWIHEAAGNGFFAFDRPGGGRMLSNWFLAAAPDCHIMSVWRDYAAEYWRGRTGHYHRFWHHGLFAKAYRKDPEFRRQWDGVPKISADGPHRYSPYGRELGRRITEDDQKFIDDAEVPVLKLTHKVLHDAARPNSVYRWLCRRAGIGPGD